MANFGTPPDAKGTNISPAMRLAALMLRTVFLCILIVVTVRVSLPQSETIWSAYETPADLVRMILGLVLCGWFVYQLFSGPDDAAGYRTWFYLGLVAVPFSLICAYAIW